MSLKKLFLYLLILSVSISALLGIGVILLGNFGETEQKILATTFTITLTSILGLACGAYLESERGKIIPFSGIAFSILAAVLWLIVIWFRGEPNEPFMKSVATATILAVAFSHLSLLSLARFDRRFAWARPTAYLLVCALAAFVIFLLWFIPKDPPEVYGRITGVLSILVASITVVTPVFHKLSSSESTGDIEDEIKKLRARIAELETKRGEHTAAAEPRSSDDMG